MMMLIGDSPRSNPTIQITTPDYQYHHYIEDLTAHIHSPLSENAFTALQRYLPSNIEEEDSNDFDFPVDAFSCDNFRMFEFKVKQCSRERSHDWTECPYAHPGEKARRRDPRKYHYSGNACPDFRKGACMRADSCEYAHGVFECWLHPARYRTLPCKDGTHCRRRVCFFAHTPDQIRLLPDGAPRTDLSPGQLSECMYGLHVKMGMRLSVSPPSWVPAVRPGLMSLPSTPVRAMTRTGMSAWDPCYKEEAIMERVESGRELRERIYAKLGKENSLDRVGESDSPAPDVGWVSELIN